MVLEMVGEVRWQSEQLGLTVEEGAFDISDKTPVLFCDYSTLAVCKLQLLSAISSKRVELEAYVLW